MQVHSHLLQVIKCDLSIAVPVEQLEGLLDLRGTVFLTHFADHDCEELRKVNAVRLVARELVDQLRKLVFGGGESERVKRHLQLLLLNGARSRSVKQIEGLLDLLLLVFRHLLLVLALFLLLVVLFRHFSNLITNHL